MFVGEEPQADVRVLEVEGASPAVQRFTGAAAAAFTVTVAYAITDPLVAEMEVCPAATAVTRPELLTVATAGSALTHATVGLDTTLPEPSRTATVRLPVLPAPVSTRPTGVTRTVLATVVTVIVSVSARPPGAVAMMSVVPMESAVTRPDALTRATAGFVLCHWNGTPATTVFPASRAVA